MFTLYSKAGKLAGLGSLLLLVILLTTANQTKACDRSSFTLDNVVMVGPEYEITATLRIGAGILGSSMGAGANTYSFGFGFFSCLPAYPVTYFTPVVVSDTTGVPGYGVDVGPGFFGTQGFIFYQVPGSYTCVTSTAYCGQVHTEETQLTFRSPVLPDSIMAYGIEGTGNPFFGCFGNSDMVIRFANPYTCPAEADPMDDDIYANMPASIRNNMPEFLTYGYTGAEIDNTHNTVTSIDGRMDQIDLQVFPNPNNGHFRVRTEGLLDQSAELLVYNLAGQEMGRQSLNAGTSEVELNLDHLTPGMYMLRIESEQGSIVRKFNVVK